MAVQTKRVAGRRPLSFSGYDEILDDVRRLAGCPTRCLGNWSLGQICDHLAKGMDSALDGVDFRPPWVVRMVAPLLKKRYIRRPMAPGFQLPKHAASLLPPPVSTAEGVAALEKAVARIRQPGPRQRNVIFGPMTREEWDQLMFRHCEMHLSFVVPEAPSRDYLP